MSSTDGGAGESTLPRGPGVGGARGGLEEAPATVALGGRRRLPLAPGALAATVLVGAIGGVATLVLAELPTKRGVAILSALAIILVALLSSHTRRIFLFCWVVSLTYNRNYFFERFEADASYGPYWNPSDVFLAALLGLWAYEAVVRKRVSTPIGPPVWPWLSPFVAVCAFSALGAIRPDWGGYEMARIARICLVVWYVRFNVRAAEWWTCAAGFATAVLIHATLGVVYVMSGDRLGLVYAFGVDETRPEVALLRLLAEGVTEGSRRADGTFGHPNTMAMYLLLVTPLFLSLAAAPLARGRRLLCALCGIAGTIGIAVTQSRSAWVLILVQCVTLAVALAGRGVVRADRALGVACVATFLGILALLPLSDRIERRLTETFREELDFRREHDRIALEIWRSAPYLGIGLNNYSDVLAGYGRPEVVTFLALGEQWRRALEIRVVALVHNIYLLMLAETGALGLASFLVFLVGTAVMAARGAWVQNPLWAAASLGLFVGTLGVHLHGLQEAALWIDPVTYSFALVVGMLNNISAIARPGSEADAP